MIRVASRGTATPDPFPGRTAPPPTSGKGGVRMRIIAFITDYAAVDRIIDHLNLAFVAEKPPPSLIIEQVALLAAEESEEYF